VLEETDRADGIERAIIDVSEILYPDFDQLLQPFFPDPFVRILPPGPRTASRLLPWPRDILRHEPPFPPSTADVEKSFAGPESELSTDELVFIRLCLFECLQPASNGAGL
jgi:hypothetical protein